MLGGIVAMTLQAQFPADSTLPREKRTKRQIGNCARPHAANQRRQAGPLRSLGICRIHVRYRQGLRRRRAADDALRARSCSRSARRMRAPKIPKRAACRRACRGAIRILRRFSSCRQSGGDSVRRQSAQLSPDLPESRSSQGSESHLVGRFGRKVGRRRAGGRYHRLQRTYLARSGRTSGRRISCM